MAQETPDETVARLQHEVDQAKIAALERQLAQAQRAAGVAPDAPPDSPVAPATSVPPSASSHSHGGVSVHRNPDGSVRISVDGQDLSLPDRPEPTTSGRAQQHMDTPANNQPLSRAPRRVPLAFRLMILPWSWWTVFALFMIAVTPIALWISFPATGVVAGIVTFLVVAGLRVRRDHLQLTCCAEVRLPGS
jgi:hypothetical protein